MFVQTRSELEEEQMKRYNWYVTNYNNPSPTTPPPPIA